MDYTNNKILLFLYVTIYSLKVFFLRDKFKSKWVINSNSKLEYNTIDMSKIISSKNNVNLQLKDNNDDIYPMF